MNGTLLNVEQLKNDMWEKRHIFIYGAGRWGHLIAFWTKKNNIIIDNIVVTKKVGEVENVIGIKTIEYRELVETGHKDNCAWIIAIKDRLIVQEVTERLLNDNYNNIYVVDEFDKELIGEECLINVKKEERYDALKVAFKVITGRDLNLDNPIYYNEKIQWLKLYEDTDIKGLLADKYRSKKWISDNIGDEYVVEPYGVWNNFEEIDFSSLPNEFVLKCNHGCGYNYIVNNKEQINLKDIKLHLDEWIEEDYGAKCTQEYHYSKISPLVFAERYVEQIDGGLDEYKIHCFAGEPRYILVNFDRDFETDECMQQVYDCEWNLQDWTLGSHIRSYVKKTIPCALSTMLEVSRKIAKYFSYVRVDMYDLQNGEVKISEITFTPCGGYYLYNDNFTEEIDAMWGELLQLPDIHNE